MHHALRSTKASVSASTLPKTLVIDINDNGKPLPMPPTHMVAVYSSTPSDSESRRILLYPIHNSILSLYCANLPVLAASTPLLATPKTLLEVPVVPLALPHPESFPVLVQFLYLKDARSLFDFFLSIVPERGIPADLAGSGGMTGCGGVIKHEVPIVMVALVSTGVSHLVFLYLSADEYPCHASSMLPLLSGVVARTIWWNL